VDYVEENAEKVTERAYEIAKKILANGPIGVQAAKLAINKGIETDLRSGLDIEKLCYYKVIATNDRVEGIRAFLEKRKPVYKGEWVS